MYMGKQHINSDADNLLNNQAEMLHDDNTQDVNEGILNDDVVESVDNVDREELNRVRQEALDNLAGWQRAKADFMNYKKDQTRALAESEKYKNEGVLLQLLPIIDSFDLALKHMPAELESSDWVKGVMCIKGLLEKFLKDVDVRAVEVLGKEFDPQIAEAISEESSEQEAGVVIEEMQRGYWLNEKILRPAKVKVSKGK